MASVSLRRRWETNKAMTYAGSGPDTFKQWWESWGIIVMGRQQYGQHKQTADTGASPQVFAAGVHHLNTHALTHTCKRWPPGGKFHSQIFLHWYIISIRCQVLSSNPLYSCLTVATCPSLMWNLFSNWSVRLFLTFNFLFGLIWLSSCHIILSHFTFLSMYGSQVWCSFWQVCKREGIAAFM